MADRQGIALAGALVANLRRQSILLPSVNVIERICAEATTRATRRHPHLPDRSWHRSIGSSLDALLNPRENSKVSTLAWLRQPRAPNAKHLLEHIDRLKAIEELKLPAGIERGAHQNRLLKLAREGGQMHAQHVRELEPCAATPRWSPWWSKPRRP